MNKPYKVTYKTYLNDRLKQVSLHGQQTYPLYVQLTYERKTIFFKSYYFELFSKPRYFLSVAGLSKGPSLEEITTKENAAIDFIISKYKDDFSIELFKEKYAYYSKDLCDETEGGFIDYLQVFFKDEGMPTFAVAISQGAKLRVAYDVVQDMKRALTKPLYDKLVQNSLYYAPPYLPLYGFMKETKSWPMLCLTVMEWEDKKTNALFEKYLKKHYPSINSCKVMDEVEKWLQNNPTKTL
ncbi:hypothetical protein FMM05_13175 [Flavobacterium zepuense]|uniref:Uncharacterized protein n=1 Tax=Flavobacterium zepuense TaxID=2593302 RepID=A0A552UZF3_9FLAO|nr:hypothetical protein [Flavobacterium zepuense]TRW23607.1 hypothetical protein FMM05_13175 [Flavobacterium zepuense]